MMHNVSTLGTLLAATGEAVLVIGPAGRIEHVSKAFESATTLPADRLAGQPVESLGKMTGQPHLAACIRDAISSAAARKDSVLLPGQSGPWELLIEPVLEQGGVIGGIVLMRPYASGKSERREGFDDLTGLPNRHLFVDRVGQALFEAQRVKKSAMVMLAGVDRFREVNDVVGDGAGDRILRDIAERLRPCIRTTDTLARLGGDQFAFVMQIAAIGDSVLLSEKVLRALEQPFSLDNQKDIALTCSLGVSLYPADGASPEELIRNATAALFHAKQGERGRCQFFSSEMNQRARNRLDMESSIRRALANREFLVYYQPKIDVNTRRVAGLEALVRWRDPVRGLVPPGEFIPVAEESGLIEPIGQWVLEETCAQNYRWQQQGLPPVCASVNVSARQFRNRNFVAMVEEILKRTGLEPRWLELEITESMLMGEMEPIIARMESLRRLGVSLSIDDFGTGYSSLGYLSSFPVTTLKIDRVFIADVQSNPQTAEIARAIIGLSRGLNLEIIAEGAEEAEQIDFLREHGCNFVQGFYYSKPVPAEEFTAMLRDGLDAR